LKSTRTPTNKQEIKAAVEKIFKVKVEKVRTANFHGKIRRRGRFTGRKPDWKKAYVTLQKGQKMIEFSEAI
jgi:large subunit ribosomal protein L23